MSDHLGFFAWFHFTCDEDVAAYCVAVDWKEYEVIRGDASCIIELYV